MSSSCAPRMLWGKQSSRPHLLGMQSMWNTRYWERVLSLSCKRYYCRISSFYIFPPSCISDGLFLGFHCHVTRSHIIKYMGAIKWTHFPFLYTSFLNFKQNLPSIYAGGALKPSDIEGLWVHVTCAWFRPEVGFLNHENMEPAVGLFKIPAISFLKV